MQASRFDLRLLQTLEAVHRLGSATAAANELSLTQPAVSHAISKMRAEFGDPLFVRTVSGMRPTPKADEIVASARRILALVRREMEVSSTFEPKALKRHIIIGMSDVGEMVFLPKLLRQLREESPLSDLSTISLPPARLAEALEAGTVDLVIGNFPDLKRAGLRSKQLFEKSFRCLLSSNHPRIKHHGISLKQFLAEPHVVVSPQSRNQEIFERHLSRQGLTRRVLLQVPHMLCLPPVLAASDLIATVPHSVAVGLAEYGGLRSVAPPLATPAIRVAQYWHQGFAQDPFSLWLRSIVNDLFAETDSKVVRI